MSSNNIDLYKVKALKSPFYWTADQAKHPILYFIGYQIIIIFMIGFSYWILIYDFTHSSETDGIGIIFFILLGMPFTLIEINLFHKIQKYGLIAAEFALGDPILREPPLLIKLRDPRVRTRKKCLVEIKGKWE